MVLGYASARMLRPLYDALIENYVPGDTVFCAHGMDLASRVAGEKLKAPVASILFAPGLLWSMHDSPRLKGAMIGEGVPRWLKRFQFTLSDKFFIRPLLGPIISDDLLHSTNVLAETAQPWASRRSMPPR